MRRSARYILQHKPFFCLQCKRIIKDVEVDCDDWEQDDVAYVTLFCHDDIKKIEFTDEDIDKELMKVFEQ